MSKLIHKYVQENEANKSAWAVLCSPLTLNFKNFDRSWKLENASYFWKNVTCAQCLRMRKLAEEEKYAVRRGLEFLAKDQ